MSLAPGTRLGPYEIVAPLGAGGMGEVYRAHDSRLGRDVAIKVLPSHLAATPEVRARFEREARTISQLNHPHICTLHDVGHQDGIDYLVMELLEGETLAHRLEKGPLPVGEVLSLGRQIADALDRAHRAGVVHRDLKPGNVMPTKGGAKLMDFGLARAQAMSPAAGALTQSPTVAAPLTAEGTIVGTFQYMAPEQLEGKEADARSDLWALGCVLYEMATGRPAFAGGTQASLISAIMRDTPRAMTELQPVTPLALERVVKRCLEKDPEDRLQSARDLAFDLEGIGGSRSGATSVVAGTGSPARMRLGWGIGVAGLLVGAFVAAAVMFMIARGARVTDAARLVYTRLTVQRGRLQDARFSSDGKTVYYSAEWNGEPPEVFETRIGFPTSRGLGLHGAHLLSASKDGRLAVLLGQDAGTWWGTLAEVPASGEAPRRILDEVLFADWSPDGMSLAVVHRTAGKVRLEWPPGRVLRETAGMMNGIRVSRGGKLVAVVDNPSFGDTRGSVAIVDRTGRVVCRTTDEWNYLGGVAWTPDDREVWFAATKDRVTTEIRAMTTAGRERVVASLPGSYRFADIGTDGGVLLLSVHLQSGIRSQGTASGEERELGWFDEAWPADISRDGRALLFSETGAYGGNLYAVCLRGMDGSPPLRLGEGAAQSLSPDGKWALAVHYGPPQRLLVLPTGAGDSTSLPRGTIEQYSAVSWLPDGRGVVFAGSEAGHAQRTYVQGLEDGLPRAISPEGIAGARVSPDGKSVAALKEQQLYIVSTHGDSTRLVADLLPGEDVCQWTPDGRALYVFRGGPSMTVSKLDASTGMRSPWRTFRLPDPAGVFVGSPVLTPDGKSYAFHYGRALGVLYQVEGLK